MASTVKILQSLERRGQLKQLVERGIIPPSVNENRQIAAYYEAKIKEGKSKSDAVYDTAAQFKKDRRKVYRALEQMR